MKIHIDNDNSSIIDDTGRVTATCYTSELAKNFFGAGNNDIGILPPAVRWLSEDGLSVIVERPPTTHRVGVYDDDEDEIKYFQIPVPWTVWGVQFWDRNLEGISRLFLLCRPAPMATIEDTLFSAQYTNIFEEDRVCSDINLESTQFRSYADALNVTVSSFWDDAFNKDLDQNVHHLISRHGSLIGYYGWLETRSIEQVLENVGQQSQHNPTVRDLIHRLNNEGSDQHTNTLAFFNELITRSAR